MTLLQNPYFSPQIWPEPARTSPNFRLCLMKMSPPQDFFRRTLCLSHPAMPIEFFMHYRGVRLWITIVRPQFPHYYTDTEWDTLHCTTTCVSAPRVKFSYSRENNKWQHISKFYNWYTSCQNFWSFYEVKCLCSRGQKWRREGCHSHQLFNTWFLWHEQLVI